YQLNYRGKGTNLHSLWDSGMLRTRKLDVDAWIERLRALPAPAVESIGPPPREGFPVAWVEQSCRASLAPGAYPKGDVGDDSDVEAHVRVQEAQLRLGAARRVEVLDTALGGPREQHHRPRLDAVPRPRRARWPSCTDMHRRDPRRRNAMPNLTALLRVAAIVLLAFAAQGCTGGKGEPLTVFAAASLQGSMDEAAAAYRQATGTEVRMSYAASSTLARQIEQGAPAQVFLSADDAWMDYLQERDRIDPGTRVELLGNSLVLVAPHGGQAALVDLARPGSVAEALGG